MSTTEEIINSSIEEATKTEAPKVKIPEIKVKDPTKKLKNLIILFGFALIIALLGILAMYFIMSNNGTKVKVLDEKVKALQQELSNKTGIAEKSQNLEAQLKKANEDIAGQTKLVEEATNKAFKAEADLKGNKDRMTKLENDNANLATAASNAKATAANLQARLDNIKSNLGN
jgi:hypothetical protein